MIFLNPAILLGMFAASIPLLIHLLNLRKLRKVEFSTLAFLKEIQKTKIRRIKLKQWILLILRMLIIAVIVASFARPALKDSQLGGAASSAKSSAVFVIDDSFSMSRIAGDGSLLNRQKAAARNILEKFEAGDELALILTSGKFSARGFKHDKNQIIKMLDKLEPANESGTIEDALRAGFDLLNGSININKEVYLFSDLQKSTLYRSGAGQRQNPIPDGAKLYKIILDDEQTRNFAVTDLRVENQIFEVGKSIRISAVISNLSGSGESGSIAFLYINGKRSAQQRVSLKAGESKLVTFETELKERGLQKILVELEEDDIAEDNQRYVSVYVPETLELALFSDDPAEFLEIIFSEDLFAENLKLSKFGFRQLAAVDLRRYSALILNGVPVGNGPAIIRDYVNDGGKVFVLPSAEETAPAFNGFCSVLGAGSNFTLIENSGSEDFSSFEETDFAHPILRNLFEAKEKKQIESPALRKYFNINPGGRGKTVISLLGGVSFLSDFRIGKGRLLLMNSAADLSWSDFPLKGIFAPLMYKSVLYLASSSGESRSITAGSDVPIDISSVSAARLKIVNPKNGTEFVDLSGVRGNQFVEFGSTEELGIYSVYSEEHLLDHFSVNFDAAESDVQSANSDDLEVLLAKLNFSGDIIDLDIEKELTEQIFQTRFGAELWRYFLLAALALILLEMYLSRSVKRELAAV